MVGIDQITDLGSSMKHTALWVLVCHQFVPGALMMIIDYPA